MPSGTLRIGMLAGEMSGDILGSHLIAALKTRYEHVVVEGIGEHLGLRIIEIFGEMLKRDCQSEEFSERIPTQMVLRDKLLHVFRRRTAGTGFVEATTSHQWHD